MRVFAAILQTILQTCDPILWGNETHRCALAGYQGFFTDAQIGVFLGFLVIAPIYVSTRDAVFAGVALILLSAALFPMLPGNVVGVAYTAIFMGLTVAVFGALYKWVAN